ncbi:TRAP transporter substrate-binding protein [Hydrogenophaga laconesensis]|uniref:TRAP-type C4-dicarboxylate transport system substrate-binding protein n=1 Tax=Hydrogenophaga laconesensis TaxID=1805971 RepID=A0ABU1VHL1_9BURK|nr:TRAP transporter substrate-binding protein [Hydrogenophaga laconesensis]MDR7096974.1 TRAP-type C4-dicarboxylate transport system substrate-binding protein [Hydrogenophaga laconesensis]
MKSTFHLAGYQGGASILTAALTTLARRLDDSSVGTPHLLTDVTAIGESAASLFASVEKGERHIGYMASGYLSARVPELAVLDLPFSVQERATALAALDGDAGTMLRDAVARQSGFHVLAFWDNGFRHISNAVRPLRSPSDCEGLVIRTLDSALYRDALDAIGFKALTTDVKDLIRVVQDGTVQAQENPLTNLLSFDLWQHHPHVSLSGHFFGVLLLVCPSAWYARLNATQRDELQAAVNEATTQQRKAAAAQDATALERLRSLGVQVVMPASMDLAAMREATAAVRQRYLDRLPARLVQAYLNAEPLDHATP